MPALFLLVNVGVLVFQRGPAPLDLIASGRERDPRWRTEETMAAKTWTARAIAAEKGMATRESNKGNRLLGARIQLLNLQRTTGEDYSYAADVLLQRAQGHFDEAARHEGRARLGEYISYFEGDECAAKVAYQLARESHFFSDERFGHPSCLPQAPEYWDFRRIWEANGKDSTKAIAEWEAKRAA